MLSHQQKLDFVLKMTKHALQHVQHFDTGGTALSPNPVAAGTSSTPNQSTNGLAGALGSVLGTNNNAVPLAATINPGTNTAQLNQAYTGAQGALGEAENLSGTLTPGVSQGANSQNQLTQELTAESQGQGPNPAQAALNQNTGQNINQAAALAAGVRGAGTNAGLVANNAANTAATTQQQAVGQEATLQAQQQLAAQGQLENVAANEVGQGTNAVQLANQTEQNEQNILQGANTAANNAQVSSQENLNTTNAQIAAGNAQSASSTLQGAGSAIAAIGALAAFAKGGVVPKHIKDMAELYHPHMAPGGMIWQNSIPVSSNINGGTSYSIPSIQQSNPYQAGSSDDEEEPGSAAAAAPGTAPTGAGGSLGLGGGDMVSQLGQIGAVTPSPSLARGGSVGEKLKSGGKVPGKPKVNHDAYKNDTVSAKLSPGEVVIDLNTLKDKGKLGQMARFVAANIERKKMGRAL